MPLTVDELLERARRHFVRVEPARAADEQAGGALLVDIRPKDQRAEEGEIPVATVIARNVLEWRLDPASQWRIPAASDHNVRVILI
jgi:rhodanese-related sulfurtransferase